LIGTYQPGWHRDFIRNDWRTSADAQRQRRDLIVDFRASAFGSDTERRLLKIEGKTDNWENFGVQWDGSIRILTAGTHLATRSDDGSRVWLDLNRNGEAEANEWGSNAWGAGGGATKSVHGPLAPGIYRIRIQYEDGDGGNYMSLLWDDAAHSAGDLDGWHVVPSADLAAP